MVNEFKVKIERLVFGGEGLGYFDNRPVFVAGVLPGEEVLVRPVRITNKFVKAVLLKVLVASLERREPREDHYLSCSPWQIMPEERQLFYKQELTEQVFLKFAKDLPLESPEIIASPEAWGYRDKLEFSFTQNNQGELSLAFNERYSYKNFSALTGCALGHVLLNDCAGQILQKLKENKIKPNALKNLVVRYSYYENKCLAALYVTDRNFLDLTVNAPNLSGLLIAYSDPRHPAAITDQVLRQQGENFLLEKIGRCLLSYHYESFFQINPPAFEAVIKFLNKNLDEGAGEAVDLYAGVGALGLPVAGGFAKMASVEIDRRACRSAKYNLALNHLDNTEVICSAVGKYELDQLINAQKTVFVDPPRAGLEPKIVKLLLQQRPRQLVYLSCNPATQARDWALLKEAYTAVNWRLFDFYPQTPHVESLLIMKARPRVSD
ncbi:MAG: 23S rRNA (uracil(1939)-C(5))-methyltransferase RlmD [Candidatus Komeilibacteria bacterium]|nr:23S rRNA (uracil(1939)-C(5))-methyltransferase RlmD [Candidatus Komeilibacteria bacterium]